MSTDFGWGPEYDRVMGILLGFFADMSWAGFQVVFWLVFFFIMSALVVSCYVGITFHTSEFKYVWPIKYLRTIVNSLVTVLFIPVTTILLTALRECTDGQYLHRFESEKILAWGPQSTIYGVLSIIALSLFVPFCLFMGLMSFEFNPRTSDIMARTNSRLEFVYIVLKAGLVFMTDLGGTGTVIVRIFYLFGFMLFMIVYMVQFSPYYKPWVNQLRTALHGAVLGAVIDILVRIATPNWPFSVGVSIVIHLASGLVMGLLSWFAMALRLSKNTRFRQYKKMSLDNTNIPMKRVGRRTSGVSDGIGLQVHQKDRISSRMERKYQNDAFHGSATVAGILGENNKSGILKKFFEGCKNYYIAMTVQLSIAFLQFNRTREAIEMAECKFLSALDNSAAPFCRIIYANFLINYKEDWLACSAQISVARRHRPTMDERWLIFVLEKQIERQKRSQMVGSGTRLGLMSYVEFQHNFNKAKKLHLLALKSIRTFWELLVSEDNPLIKLGAAHRVILGVEIKCMRSYSQLVGSFYSSPVLWRSYGAFLQDVRNDSDEAETAFQLADELEEKKAKHRTKIASVALKSRQPPLASIPEEMGESEKEHERKDPVIEDAFTNNGRDADTSVLASLTNFPESNDTATDDDTTQSDKSENLESDTGRTDSTRSGTNTSSSKTSNSRYLREVLKGNSTTRETKILDNRFNQGVIILLMLLFGNFVVVFVLVDVQNRNLQAVSIATKLRSNIGNLAMHVSEMSLGSSTNVTQMYEESNWKFTPKGRAYAAHEIEEIASEMREQIDFLNIGAVDIDQSLVEYWENHILYVRYFNPYYRKPMLLQPALQLFIERALLSLHHATELEEGVIVEEHMRECVDIEFTVRNSIRDVYDSANELVETYINVFVKITDTLQTIVIIVASVVVVLAASLGLFVFRPTIFRIHSEKHLTLGLFAMIPRRQAFKIAKNIRICEADQYKVLSTEDKDSDDSDHEEYSQDYDSKFDKVLKRKKGSGSGVGEDNHKKMQRITEIALTLVRKCKEFRGKTMQYAFSLLVLSIIVSAHVFTVSLELVKDGTLVKRVDLSMSRTDKVSGIVNSMYFLPERERYLIYWSYNPENEWTVNDMVERKLDELVEVHRSLVYGNQTLQITGAASSFTTDARKLLSQNIETEIAEVRKYGRILALSNETTITYADPGFREIFNVWRDPGTLKSNLNSAAASYLESVKISHDTVKSINGVWLAAEVLILIGLYVMVLRKIVYGLKESTSSLIRLLHMLPSTSMKKLPHLIAFMDDPDHFQQEIRERQYALKKSDDRLDVLGKDWSMKLVNSSAEAVIVATAKGKILFLNKKAQETFGYDQKEIIGQNVDVLVPLVLKKQHNKAFALAVKRQKLEGNKKSRTMEVIAQAKSGKTFEIELTVSILKVDSRSLARQRVFTATIRKLNDWRMGKDDTNGVSTEWDNGVKELRLTREGASKKLATQLIEMAPSVTMDLAGKVGYISKPACNLFKTTASKVIGKRIESLLLGNPRNEVGTKAIYSLIEKAVFTEHAVKLEHQMKEFGQSGRFFSGRITLETVTLNKYDGERVLLAKIEDISERQLFEVSARRNESWLDAILETSQAALVVTDESKEVLLFSHAAENLFGIRASTIVGLSADSLVAGQFEWPNSPTHHLNVTGRSGNSKAISLTLNTACKVNSMNEKIFLTECVASCSSSIGEMSSRHEEETEVVTKKVQIFDEKGIDSNSY